MIDIFYKMYLPFLKTNAYKIKQELVGQLVEVDRNIGSRLEKGVYKTSIIASGFDSDQLESAFEQFKEHNFFDFMDIHNPEHILISERATVAEKSLKNLFPKVYNLSQELLKEADRYEKLQNSPFLYLIKRSDLERKLEDMKTHIIE